MKKIKIFLASSVVEFEHERKELGDYIRTLNDMYIERDIYFNLVICEDLRLQMSGSRKNIMTRFAIANSFISCSEKKPGSIRWKNSMWRWRSFSKAVLRKFIPIFGKWLREIVFLKA